MNLAALGLATAAAATAAVLVSGVGDPPPQFVDIARQAGVLFHHTSGASPDKHLVETMGSGGLFFDYDGDGWIDIFLVDGGSLADAALDRRARHRLYHNRGNGTFEDVTDRSGIQHRAYGMGACAGDYDGDGLPDLYITNYGANALYHNRGGGVFEDVTATAHVGDPRWSTGCAFADLDGDGDLDLWVVNYVDADRAHSPFCGDARRGLRFYCHPLKYDPLSSTVYRNDGGGVFTDVSAASGVGALKSNGLGIVIGDYDDDGRPDVFVANDTMPNFLFHNAGGLRFTETGLVSGIALASDGRARAGMGIDTGDYDGDGRLDLFVSGYVHTQLDIAIANGHILDNAPQFRAGSTYLQRKLLFRNTTLRRFEEVGRTSGPAFAVEKVGRGLAVGDIDNDGDLDLLVTNNGQDVELLRNDGGNRGNSLLVQLRGAGANIQAIGARIRLTAGPRTQMRDVKAGSSYLSQNDLRAHFGLGAAARADRIEVRWPSGRTEAVMGVAANQIVTIEEGRGIVGARAFAQNR